MNPSGVFKDGARQIPWNVKEVPPFSAKLMPEFYQRRSIKDMFKKPSVTRSISSSQATTSTTTPSGPESNGLAFMHATTDKTDTAIDTQVSASSRPRSIAGSPDRKRSVSETQSAKPAKKQKVAASTTTKPAPAKGQQSLKGFFQPKGLAKQVETSPKKAETITTEDEYRDGGSNGLDLQDYETSVAEGNSAHASSALSTSRPQNGQPHTQSPSRLAAQMSPSKAAFHPPNEDDGDDLVHDPIVSKESWQTLFRKKAAPLCEGHEEPCKSMLTKKKGENQGRSFWMCTRPLGPSGQKEKGTQWRCGTFIWCSDWKGD